MLVYSNTVMKTRLSNKQIEQLDDLIDGLVHAITEDGVIEPDMSDIQADHPDYNNICEDRMNLLYIEALAYLKNSII